MRACVNSKKAHRANNMNKVAIIAHVMTANDVIPMEAPVLQIESSGNYVSKVSGAKKAELNAAATLAKLNDPVFAATGAKRIRQHQLGLDKVGAEQQVEIEKVLAADHLSPDEQMDPKGLAVKKNVLRIGIRERDNPGPFERHARALVLTEQECDIISERILGMGYDEILDICNGDAQQAAKIFADRERDPKSFMTSILIDLANKNQGVSSWLFRRLDDHHNMYTPDGTIDRSKLPSDQWDVARVPIFGEVAYLKKYKNKLPVAQDHAHYHEYKRKLSPLDNRINSHQLDVQRQTSFLGRLMTILRSVFSSSMEIGRVDKNDKEYNFPLEEEKPFDGVAARVATGKDLANEFYLNDDVIAALYTDARSGDKPSRIFSRTNVQKIFCDMHNLRGVAEGGLEKKEEETADKPKAP